MTETPASLLELAKILQLASVEWMAASVPDARIIEITPCLAERWRVTREEIIGQTLAKYGKGKLSARHVTDETNDAGQNAPTRVEVTYSPPAGAPKHARFSAQLMKADGKEVMLLIGQSSRAALATETRDVERRLQLALRSGGYALWDYDYSTGVSNLSPEVYEMLGFPVGDSSLNFKSWNERVHPDDVNKTIDHSLAHSGNNVDQWQTKYRVRTRDEKYIWVEVIAGMVRDPIDGRPTKTIGLARNITEQMNAFERLRFSERNLRRSQAAARLGSWAYRIDTGIVKLSEEMMELFGIADTVLPPSLTLLESYMHAEDQEKWREALELAKIGRNVPALEFMLRLPNGDERHIEASIEAERENGHVVSLFGICQDISERKALEKKYLQAQKMEAVGQLTGGIAHDFNNLMMVVMGNLQLVDQLVRDDERAARRIKAALDAVERGSELTKRLLAFSRQQTLQSTAIDLNVQIPKMESILRQAVGESIELTVAPATEIWPINVDVTQLETAVLNLCINARDAMMPKGGKLVLELSNITLDETYCALNDEVVPGDYAMLAVTDTGCGIPKENLDKVFQPFFTTKPPEAGSGLGLSMIYGFVKQSGGHIKIYSEVGHGTSVKIYLPRARSEETEHTGADAKPKAEMRRKQRAVVLVVEDNEAVRDVAAAMIAELGVETLTASNGAEALKIIESRKDLDLILSDVIMAGGMNGPELAARALKMRPELKLLFMSGYAPGSVRQMQELPDTIDLVNKPFTRNDLTSKVKRALAA